MAINAKLAVSKRRPLDNIGLDSVSDKGQGVPQNANFAT
jgi:hypothetical protein